MTCMHVFDDFIAAMEANDKSRILAFFDERSVFTNVPVGSVTGRDAIWTILGSIHDHALSVQYRIHNVACDEVRQVVLTERTDCYQLPDRMIKFRAMGVFEFDGAVIREWRDYFDLKQCMDQMPEGTQWPT